ncbi:MAG: hypothetical protein AB7O52_14140 [Planctomycetota bacterium]
MTGLLRLAWRYVCHHRVRSGLLVGCIALTLVLPFATELLVAHYQRVMTARAAATPLLAGAKGSRFDLLLSALYFRGSVRDLLSMADLERVRDPELGLAIPLFRRHTARGYPVVGTTLDYLEFRGLRVAAGTPPLRLGDAVLGSGVAAALGLGPGDSLISDARRLYDISASYPLEMHITGVLAPARTADDGAVFVDLKTAWIIEGVGHGHQEVSPDVDPALVLERSGDNVATNAAIVEYTRITDANRASFHFHGGADSLPLTSILLSPRDAKAATILKGRLLASKNAQPLVPTESLAELLDIVFQVKRFFDAHLVMVSAATVLFLVLVILLTVKVRQREIDTLFKLGCSRARVAQILATELCLVIGAGVLLAASGAGLVYWILRTYPLMP